MKKTNKVLSLILVLSMVFSMTLNVGATENIPDADLGEVISEEESKDSSEDAGSVDDGIIDDSTANDGDVIEEEIPETDTGAGSQDDGIMMLASNTVTKPADGTAAGQPFPTDIGVGHYRIPALITLGESLIAAADARWGAWQTPDDCANIDTIVSRSSDKGESWSYTFANYIADNGNTRDFNAATFIDPALAYDGTTLYMIVDLFPGQSGSQSGKQNCTAASQTGTGFDENGNLLLKKNARSWSYDYYLKDGKIYQVSDNKEVSGYTVDDYFNLSQNGTVLGNLFTYSTGYFQPLMTSYLCLTTSTDGGATWSAPTLLNLKNTQEKAYIVSPGRGLVTSDGTIVFPCYTYSGSAVHSNLIYSTNSGQSWQRTADASFASNEGDIVELSDGTLRYFYRHSANTLCYVDITKDYTFGTPVTVSNVSIHSDCNLSAITYSKTADGKQVILVSCPTGSGRNTGKIFTFTVEGNNTLAKAAEYSVNGSNAFSYSSMSELSDGSIGILYEKGDSGNITYENLAIDTIASGVTFDSTGGGTGGDTPGGNTPDTKDITLYVGDTKTVTDKSGNYESTYSKDGLDESIATVAVKGTTDTATTTVITITGIAAGNTSVTVGNTVYHITVRERPEVPATTSTNQFVSSRAVNSIISSGDTVTGLVLSYGTATGATTSFEIKVTDASGNAVTDGVTWKSTDESIATVVNGKITAAGVGECVVYATYEDGTVTAIPVRVIPGNTASTSRLFSVYIDKLLNTELYYAIVSGANKDDEWTLMPEGTMVYANLDYNKNSGIVFGAKPDEGYAITYCGHSTNGSSVTAGYFHQIRDESGSYGKGGTASQTSGYFYDYATSSSLGKLATQDSGELTDSGDGIYLKSELEDLLDKAVVDGLDAGFFYSRQGNDGTLSVQFQVISDKLPTMTKKITSIEKENGTVITGDSLKNAVLELGDTIYYDIDITTYKSHYATYGSSYYGSTAYSDAALTDELTGMNQMAVTLPQTSGAVALSQPDTVDKTVTTKTSFTLSMNNFNKVNNGILTNVADLNYTYKTTYSTGKAKASANATAECRVGVPEYVIDFGLPVVIDMENKLGGTAIDTADADYGEITVDKNRKKFTYTPSRVLEKEDYITLSLTNGQSYGVRIYPATTVYYEEGFATYSEGWSNIGSKGTGTQTPAEVGSGYHYGYDSKYANESSASNQTQATSSTAGANAALEFTGTGIETYANCSSEAGAVTVQIRNAEGRMVKLASVDTTAKGTYGNTVLAGAYNTPIVSVNGLPHGNYTEKVFVVKGTVNLDGFRVYGTLSDEATNTVYTADLEENPSYFEMRDAVLTAMDVNTEDSAAVYAQVYAKTDGQINGAVVLSNAEVQGDNNNAETLLKEGPKNELYLAKDQALVFKIKTDRVVQIGLKAPSGETSYEITGMDGEQSISSSTDMFYTVNKGTTAEEQTITITNKGDGILSVTKLKVCDDPTAAFGELTEADIEEALVSLSVSEPEVTYADATLTLSVNDKAGNVLASTTLTANGIAGESHTFTAAEIASAAAGLVLPEGYELDETEYMNVTVAYGESGTAVFTASEQAAEPEPEPEKPQSPMTNIVQKIVKTVNTVIKFFGKIFGRR